MGENLNIAEGTLSEETNRRCVRSISAFPFLMAPEREREREREREERKEREEKGRRAKEWAGRLNGAREEAEHVWSAQRVIGASVSLNLIGLIFH